MRYARVVFGCVGTALMGIGFDLDVVQMIGIVAIMYALMPDERIN